MKSQFIEFLIAHKVIGIKPDGITLKSGRVSHWYANFRILSQSLSNIEKAASMIAQYMVNENLLVRTDMVMGVPQGASLLGDEVSKALIRMRVIPDALYLRREKPKTHGDVANKSWVTGLIPKHIWRLEDVTTSGISAFEHGDLIAEKNPEVIDLGLFGLLNRLQLGEGNQSVIELAKKRGIRYVSMTDANDILPHLLDTLSPDDRQKYRDIINEEYRLEYAEAGKKSPVLLT